MKQQSFNKTPLAAGVAVALGAAGISTASAQQPGGDVIEEIVSVGIRGSLTSSANLKRTGQGVQDGIVAEDIGKFPDTNLAESMQRITGVSIDRTAIGEGSRVTVRGVGPDFNLVTLNGRQMPGTTIEATSANDSRSFDFANLASEAVSAVEVYKTSQARLPSGGMGATINIRTARPFDNPDMVLNIGAKAVLDQSVENGDDVTPEISGIFSNTFADGKFGVAVTGSYQDRNLSYAQASAPGGFRTNFGDNSCCSWGNLPDDGTNGTTTTNRPGDTDLYLVPQALAYTFNDIERTRTNAQLVLQFAPTDTVTATVDYTYAENEILEQSAQLSGWNGFSSTVISSWTDGPTPAPLSYAEVRDPGTPPAGDPTCQSPTNPTGVACNPEPNTDFGGNMGQWGVVHELDSIGLNIEWDPTDNLGLELDFHTSESDSGRASAYGTNNAVGFYGFFRGTTITHWDKDFPVYEVELAPGTTGIDPAQTFTTGSSFRNAVSTNEVEQIHLSGEFFFDDPAYGLDFGVMLTDVENQSAYSNVQADTWGGVGSPADFDDSLFEVDNVRGYFSNVPGSSDPRLFNEFIRVNFPAAIDVARNVIGGTRWGPAADGDWDVDRRTNEETLAAYVQFNASFEIGGKPANLAAGVRYEETDVTSKALVPVPQYIEWAAANEFTVVKSGEDFTNLKGDYDYVLPSVDFNVEIADDLILRFGYSETIGRPSWADIQGGQTIDDLIRLNGGNGNQGDPGLLPLESANIDLSVEWYYGQGSYVSLAYFEKDIENYITIDTIQGTPFDLPHPGLGLRAQTCDAATGGAGDANLIRDCIFTMYGNTPEVDPVAGTIRGIPGEDPAAPFQIFVPTNAGKNAVDGWELAVQHFFGDSGFGFNANYTIVDTDDEYDDTDINQQFVLEGISDSANLIVFYEDDKWSARLAYNWRDEYLSGRFDGVGWQNPNYTEAYGQFDANVSYNVTDDLVVILEGINITDEYQRVYIRHPNAAAFVTTTGPRYMIGARYNFR